MFQTLALVALLAAPPADLTYQQLGPCHRWEAHTEKGEKFLKALPDKYKAPNMGFKDGKEVVIGRSEYNAKTKSIYASPSVLRHIELLAEAEGMKFEEYDPY